MPARGPAKGQKQGAGQRKGKAGQRHITSSKHEGDKDRTEEVLRCGEKTGRPNLDHDRRTRNVAQVDLGLRLAYASAFNLVAKHNPGVP